MLFVRILVLAGIVMASSLVMATEDVSLKQCTGGFELSYFNFYIDIQKFTEEECEDFDEIGKMVQTVIEEIQDCIPEYENEFINAEVCPEPTFVEERRLHLRSLGRRRRAGTYSFAGTGGCKRCRRSSSDRRRLDVEEDTTEIYYPAQLNDFRRLNEFKRRVLNDDEDQDEEFVGTLEERICIMGDAAVVDAAVAERAVPAAEKKLQELLTVAEEQETTDLIEVEDIEKYIEDAKQKLEEVKEDRESAKARALFLKSACDSANAAVLDKAQFEDWYLWIAGNMTKSVGKDAKHAQGGYYKVKDEKIGLKTDVVKTKFGKRKIEMEEEHDKLAEDLDGEIEDIEDEIKELEREIKAAKKDKEKQEELEKLEEALVDGIENLKDEYEKLMRMDVEKFDQEYDFAIGTLEVEAANTFEDYMEAFADLIKPALEERLQTFSACFDGQPSVKVEVVELESKREQLTECPE